MIFVRKANESDEQAIFDLASQLATSFVVERDAFTASFQEILQRAEIYLPVAEISGCVIAYLLGYRQPTFYANGPVAWAQEIVVAPEHRRRGAGKLLMHDFERWAAGQKCQLVSLATRRAAQFYKALGYDESATYFRKRL
jgi:GNAT superfamily N-acetyltransferase